MLICCLDFSIFPFSLLSLGGLIMSYLVLRPMPSCKPFQSQEKTINEMCVATIRLCDIAVVGDDDGNGGDDDDGDDVQHKQAKDIDALCTYIFRFDNHFYGYFWMNVCILCNMRRVCRHTHTHTYHFVVLHKQ